MSDSRTNPEKYNDAMTRACRLYEETAKEKPLRPAQIKWTSDMLRSLLRNLCFEQEHAPVKGSIGYNQAENWITAVRRAAMVFREDS